MRHKRTREPRRASESKILRAQIRRDPSRDWILRKRNLLYTAVTRGKKLVVLIASKKSLGIAVTNNRTAERYGLLLHRLQAM